MCEALAEYWENNADLAMNLSDFWRGENVNLQRCVPLRLYGDGADVLGSFAERAFFLKLKHSMSRVSSIRELQLMVSLYIDGVFEVSKTLRCYHLLLYQTDIRVLSEQEWCPLVMIHQNPFSVNLCLQKRLQGCPCGTPCTLAKHSVINL